MNYPLPNEPWKPVNIAEIPDLEAKIAAAKGTPEYDTLKSQYDGPDHGIDYHDDTGKFVIASGWHGLVAISQRCRQAWGYPWALF